MRRNVDIVAILVLLAAVLTGSWALELRSRLRALNLEGTRVRHAVQPHLIELRDDLREAGRQLRNELQKECEELRTESKSWNREAVEIRREAIQAREQVRQVLRETIRNRRLPME